jgi:LDH2 family malate/lactate/ureidoglycolate dehydrogenase
MEVSIDTLRSLSIQALETIYTQTQAERMTEIMLYADEAGIITHGVIRLIIDKYGLLYSRPERPAVIHKRSSISRLIDGNGNPGMMLASIAMDEALEIAEDHGIAIIGTNGAWSSTGPLAYYMETIARKGYGALMVSQSVPGVVPYGARKAMFGTNPIGFGVPVSGGDPIILDMATSITTFGGVVRAKLNNEQLPEGYAFDEEGRPTTDPARALDGGVAPFDKGYKGSNLGMMVEFLGGLLGGASFLGLAEQTRGWGNFLMVFSPTLLLDRAVYDQRVAEFISYYLDTPAQQGQKLRLPGAGTMAKRREALERGTVTVDDKVITQVEAYLKTV